MRKLKDLTWLIILPLIMFGLCTPAWSADTKVSDLDELAAGSIVDADVFYVVDMTGPTSKKYAWSSAKGDMKTYMNTVYQGLYVVDALVTYGAGVNYTKATIDSALAAIGTTNKAVLLLAPGTWTITDDSDYSTFGNVLFHVQDGATLALTNTKTLTLPGPANLIAEKNQQIFSGTGLVSFSKPGTVYPEWWGIGGTADQMQGTLAYSSLIAGGGGTVKWSGSSYTFSDQAVIQSNTTTEIDRQTTIKLADSLDGTPLFFANTETNIEINGGGVIDGNRSSQNAASSSYNIHLVSCTGVKISGVRIKSAFQNNIHLDGSTNVEVTGCEIDDAENNGMYIIDSSHIRVKDNYFHDNVNSGGTSHILVYTGNTDVKITHNTFSGTGIVPGQGHGVYVDTVAGMMVSGNYFYDLYGYGVELNPSVSGHARIIDGNYFDQCGTASEGTGAIFAGGTDSIIINNIIMRSGYQGIYLTNGDRNVISNNIILDSQGTASNGVGIRSIGNNVSPIIMGNVIADTQVSKTQLRSLSVSDDPHIIIGNSVNDNIDPYISFPTDNVNHIAIGNMQSAAGVASLGGRDHQSTYVGTLSGNFLFTRMYYRTLLLSPGGANRTVNPSGVFNPGDDVFVKNTAGADNLVFDSTGLNHTLTPGQVGYFVYSGSAWTVMWEQFTIIPAATITVVDSTDATSYVALFDSATGNLAIKTDLGITYDSTTGILYTSGGYSTAPTASPSFTMQDSDAAPGQAGIYGMSAGGAYDVIMSLGVEDSASSTVPTVYIELDGVTETVDILKPLVASTTVTVGTSLLPDTVDGATIGSTSAEWSDIYLATGAVIYGENGQTNNLTSSSTGWTASLDLTVLGGDLTLGSAGAAARLTGGNGFFTFTGAGDGGTAEALTLNLNTSNAATISTSTGVLTLGFSAINLVTTGTISGLMPTVVENTATTYNITQAQARAGTFFVNTNAGTKTWVLPAAEAGMAVCVRQGQSVAQIMRADTDGTDYLVLHSTGVRTTSAGDYIEWSASAKN